MPGHEAGARRADELAAPPDDWMTGAGPFDPDELVRWAESYGHPEGWEPTAEERRAIADGANVELIVWGAGHPPVAMRSTDVPLGARPRESADAGVASIGAGAFAAWELRE